VNCEADLESFHSAVTVSKPLPAYFKRANYDARVVEKTRQVAAPDKIESNRTISFNPISLGGEYQSPFALFRELPGGKDR
jgi:hypothetical protein